MADLVLSLQRFLASPSFRNSDDGVYATALRSLHGSEKHTESEWKGLIESLKSQPVTYDNLRRTVPAARSAQPRTQGRRG